jgi:hypothetical protein
MSGQSISGRHLRSPRCGPAGGGGQDHPPPERARPESGADHRRPASPSAGHLEPADERCEVPAEEGTSPGSLAARRLARRDSRQRHGTGHRSRRASLRHQTRLQRGKASTEAQLPGRSQSRQARPSSSSSKITASSMSANKVVPLDREDRARRLGLQTAAGN